MITFGQWLQMRESSPQTRTRRDVALGLKPLAALGSLHGRSTAAPWEEKAIRKAMGQKKKKRKKFGATPSKKKVGSVHRNVEIDNWIKEADELKKALSDLRAAIDKKSSELKAKKKDKPEKKEEPKKKEPEEKSKDEKDKPDKNKPDKSGKKPDEKPKNKDEED